jgi:cytochrome P450
VLAPVRLDTGDVTYEVPPGWTVATLLPLLNTSAAPGLAHWDPDRWARHRLIDQNTFPSPTLVTAFGHGRHSCPAQPFSLTAMTAATTQLLGRYRMAKTWTGHPHPVPAQIGGVARADGPCLVDYVEAPG